MKILNKMKAIHSLKNLRLFSLAFLITVIVVTMMLPGCGFQLRGNYDLSPYFNTLSICPDNRLDPFQRVLRRMLKSNGICVVGSEQAATQQNPCLYTLSILSEGFSERNLAYGSDLQVNRLLLQFQVRYQILTPGGEAFCNEAVLRVERELTVNPNAVLGTETERHWVEAELLNDAAVQLIRQLSVLKPQ